MNPEQQRIAEANAYKKHWRKWGPYLRSVNTIVLFFLQLH